MNQLGICIRNFGYEKRLTIGRIYLLDGEYVNLLETFVHFRTDSGMSVSCYKQRFIILPKNIIESKLMKLVMDWD